MKPQRVQWAAEDAGKLTIQPATAQLTALITIRLNTKKLYAAPADQGIVRDSINNHLTDFLISHYANIMQTSKAS